MNPGLPRTLLLVAGAAAGYAVVMRSQPTRASFREGWRCLARYKRLATIPLLFAVCHAAFTLYVRFDEARHGPGGPAFPLPWSGWHAAAGDELLTSAWLPALEGLAATFNCVVTTFPLSAAWGVLFICNWRGYQALAGRGLRRQFGPWVGALAQAALVTCALAACAKPVFFGRIAWLSARLDERSILQAGEGINWLSFLFEYTIGVGVQVYLLSLAFAWIRGLTFDLEALRRFALRRWVLVSQWAGLLLLVSSVGINLPLLLTNVPGWPGCSAESAGRIVTGTRWLLAVGLTLFCSVQIRLVFHSETLWRAWRDHFRLLGRHGWHVGWFLLVAGMHYLLLAAANIFLPRALGDWTWPAAGWRTLVYPLLWAVLSAWILAAWVCLFRRCEAGQPERADLVRF